MADAQISRDRSDVNSTKHHVVQVLPINEDIEVEVGESLMAAAQRSGYKWPTICGGQGTCRTCYVELRDGVDQCATIGALEQEGIRALKKPVDGWTRLACQLRISGDGVVVMKRGVRLKKN
ncbi:(2Fe-2S)-binding protein [Rhodococcus pseudokoreensis]|uniref:(2Fe-2S)-binding protein n=1 Tax=Rhodococcus pseudokoreensis TaxID=2811421 RepID=A0A974W6T4_9NOCA|nr:2Fe-2S iron-sulfur cluster-binding protein [Rhodococcus pseudokoreensis]QSE92101.1 (2Fe-2S)-binding protein [Rhodococcus pseudokoreensis]